MEKDNHSKQGIKLPPSQARIMNMSMPVLIEHYNLVQLKVSRLSSTQRKMVEGRVKFNLSKGKILQSDIDSSLEHLKKLL